MRPSIELLLMIEISYATPKNMDKPLDAGNTKQ